MRHPEFYLGEGEFTKQTDYLRAVASQMEEPVIKGLINFVKSIPLREERRMQHLWRQRTASQIAEEKFSTGCTDYGLVFVTLARIIGYPAAYVETVEREYLMGQSQGVSGHIFVDVYKDGRWAPYNPRYRRTVKQGKVYHLRPNDLKRQYIEIGRGLDFSQLFTDETSDVSVELKTLNQLSEFIARNRERLLSQLK